VNATRPSNALATEPSLHERSALNVVNVVLQRGSSRECRSDGGPPCKRILSITVRRKDSVSTRRKRTPGPELCESGRALFEGGWVRCIATRVARALYFTAYVIARELHCHDGSGREFGITPRP
jgi:hypothetical protein